MRGLLSFFDQQAAVGDGDNADGNPDGGMKRAGSGGLGAVAAALAFHRAGARRARRGELGQTELPVSSPPPPLLSDRRRSVVLPVLDEGVEVRRSARWPNGPQLKSFLADAMQRRLRNDAD